MSEAYEAAIMKFPLFQGYTAPGARMLLQRGEVREYAVGEKLFAEGDDPKFVVLLLSGRLQVFVERKGKDMVLTDVEPGTIVGELAVLCGIPRSASVRASEKSAALQLTSAAFRSLLLGDAFLSERVFRQSLRTLIDKERSLIESLNPA